METEISTEVSEQVLNIKNKLVNELAGTHSYYIVFRHFSGGRSYSEQLVHQLMQAAYDAAWMNGAEYARKREQHYSIGPLIGEH